MATIYGGLPCIDPALQYRECLSQTPPLPTETWWGRANGFDLAPVGSEYGRGWLLLRGEDISALGSTSDHDLTFSGTDTAHKYTLKKITLLSASCITPGYDGDPAAVHLCQVADRRYHLTRIPIDKAFNVRGPEASDYLTPTTNSGTAWTWQGVIDTIVGVLGETASQFVLPFTPDGTPEDLAFWAGTAWDALCDVLDRLACAPKYNIETDVLSVVRLGATDSTATASQTKYLPERMWDGYPTDPVRAWRPEKVRVRFLRRPRPLDGYSPYYTVDVTLTATTGVKAGTVVQLDDDLAALNPTGTPTNSAALSTRATERANDWLRKRESFGRPLLKVYRDFIPGVIRDVPGATVGSVALDDRGGPMRTEIAARPDKLLERWLPLSKLPRDYPADTGFFARLTTSSSGKWKWVALTLTDAGVYTDDGSESAYFNAVPLPVDGTDFQSAPVTGMRVWMRRSKTAAADGKPQYEFEPLDETHPTVSQVVSVGTGEIVTGPGFTVQVLCLPIPAAGYYTIYAKVSGWINVNTSDGQLIAFLGGCDPGILTPTMIAGGSVSSGTAKFRGSATIVWSFTAGGPSMAVLYATQSGGVDGAVDRGRAIMGILSVVYQSTTQNDCTASGSMSDSDTGTQGNPPCSGDNCDQYLVTTPDGTQILLTRTCTASSNNRWAGGAYLLTVIGTTWLLFAPPPPAQICTWGAASWDGTGSKTFTPNAGNPGTCNANVTVACV